MSGKRLGHGIPTFWRGFIGARARGVDVHLSGERCLRNHDQPAGCTRAAITVRDVGAQQAWLAWRSAFACGAASQGDGPGKFCEPIGAAFLCTTMEQESGWLGAAVARPRRMTGPWWAVHEAHRARVPCRIGGGGAGASGR